MPSRAKKVAREVAKLPSIPKELVALFLNGPMTGEAINGKRSSEALLPLGRTDVLGRPWYGVFELSLWMTLSTTRRVSSGGLSC